MRTYIGLALTAACLLLFGLSSCDPGQKKVSLRLKFEKGLKLNYQQVTSGSSEVWQNDSLARRRRHNNTMQVAWEVKHIVDDTVAEVLQTRETKYYIVDEASDSVVFDTTMPEGGYVYYTQPNGKIVDLALTTAASSVDLAYTQDYLEQGTPVYPSGEFGIGHEWTQSTRVLLPEGPIEAVTKYRLKSFARERGYDCAVIEFAGNMVVPIQPFDNMFLEDEAERYQQLSGVDHIRSTGSLYFAYLEGLVVLQSEKWILDGNRVRWFYNKPTNDTITDSLHIEYDVVYSLTGREPSK